MHDLDLIENINKKQFLEITENNSLKILNRCGTGVPSCGIGFNGDIYSCLERPSRDFGNKGLYLGNINTGLDREKHKIILNNILNDWNETKAAKNECKNKCIKYERCAKEHCISSSYDNFDNTNTISAALCYVNKEILKNCICNLKILINENNKILDKYLLKNVPIYRKIYAFKKLKEE